MKITEVRTVRVEEHAELIALLLETDAGLTGLGETCFGPESVEAYIHESVAPRLLGQDPLTIERYAKELPAFYVTHGGTGVSTRAHSAVDIALWDLFGKVCEQPLYQLLGGKVRESAPIYNTCGGYHYGKAEARHRGTSRPAAPRGAGRRGGRGPGAQGPVRRPGRLPAPCGRAGRGPAGTRDPGDEDTGPSTTSPEPTAANISPLRS